VNTAAVNLAAGSPAAVNPVNPAVHSGAAVNMAVVSTAVASTPAVSMAVANMALDDGAAAVRTGDRVAKISRAAKTTAPADGIAITRVGVKADTEARGVITIRAVLALANGTANAGAAMKVVVITTAVITAARRNAAGGIVRQMQSPRGSVMKKQNEGDVWTSSVVIVDAARKAIAAPTNV
jgi:hypothetical protein